ncbi:hypothetical protein GCM10023149_48960 [Mucilaginibacter gynuensis]|uniref:Peptidase S24/S26A/S26B/S26C domain-containing protein n=1 Tax=Mucilaginibacter gynuensis TaxID=1302236 RepID=A0ABP8HFV2_9SPHI
MEEIIKKLINSDLKTVEAATGIPYDRMYKWIKGKGNPKIEDYNILVAYFDGSSSINNVTGKQFKTAIIEKYPDISEAAKELGLNPEELLKIFKKAKVTENVLEEAYYKLGIVVEGHSVIKPEGIVRNLYSEPKGIPMYSDKAAASAVELYNDEASDQEPAFFVSIPQFADCDFGKMIFGHSMYPTYESGSYAFMKRVGDLRQVSPGEVYYIETTYLKVTKRLQYGKLGFEDDHFLAMSDNEEKRPDGGFRYETFPIFKEDIKALYIVKGALKQNQN